MDRRNLVKTLARGAALIGFAGVLSKESKGSAQAQSGSIVVASQQVSLNTLEWQDVYMLPEGRKLITIGFTLRDETVDLYAMNITVDVRETNSDNYFVEEQDLSSLELGETTHEYLLLLLNSRPFLPVVSTGSGVQLRFSREAGEGSAITIDILGYLLSEISISPTP